MIFKTSLDRLAQVITVGVTFLFGAIIVTQYNDISGWKIGLTYTMILIYGLCLFLRPLHYKLTADQIVIHSLLFNWTIERSTIAGIQEVSSETLRPSIRVFGVGGLFGYYGFFSNLKLGNFRMLATRRDHAVLIETENGKKWVITPDDPKAFVMEFKGRV